MIPQQPNIVNQMKILKKPFYLASLAACLSATAQGSLLLYDQPILTAPDAFSSQNDPGANGNFALVYDNFTLGSMASITGVNWSGQYYNPTTLGPITQYTLSFYTSAAGSPGPLISSVTITGTAGETLMGGQLSLIGGQLYNYNATLPGAGFSALGGIEYWLSIQPTLNVPPQWGWNIGSGGDGTLVQDFYGITSHVAHDMAFSLTGEVSAVPEPSQVASLAGFLSAGLFIRRRYQADKKGR